MEKEVNDFILNWNSNIDKVDTGSKTYYDLIEFCISENSKIFKNFRLDKLIIDINANEKEYERRINSFEEFKQYLHFYYHSKKVKNNSNNRKFIYRGQNNRGNEVKIERKIEIIKSKIKIPKISQKQIDRAIVRDYISDDIDYSYDYFSVDLNSKEKFIFHQLNLHNNSTYKLRKWFDILKNYETHFNPDDLTFLSRLYHFFKHFQKLETEQDKIEFWFKKIKENQRFESFIDYFPKTNTLTFGESLISLFKRNHFDNLNSEFEKNLKKSINKNDFMKIRISELNTLLKEKKNKYDYSIENYNLIYQDLIKGSRENYYNNVNQARLAGTTEAIVDFINYLENYNKNSKRKIPANEITPKTDLIPIELFDNTRNYLIKNVKQINICYKYKAYDACFVLLRKVTETLIIELYEEHRIEDNIKDSDGNYFMLKKLIASFQNETKFKNLNNRNIKEILPKIKRNGDLSAHKMKFNARKLDVDRIRDDYRIVFEELICSIYN